MNRMTRAFGVLFSLAIAPLAAASPADKPSTAASIGAVLRDQFLGTTARELHVSANAEFPRVFGVAMDWPVGENTATVIALSDGSASLYTTSTFGIIGGGAHASVRRAARRFVSLAERHVDGAAPISAHPYPAAGKVRFYFLTYDGLRSVETDLDPIESGSSPFRALFAAGQDVLTELRLTTPKE